MAYNQPQQDDVGGVSDDTVSALAEEILVSLDRDQGGQPPVYTDLSWADDILATLEYSGEQSVEHQETPTSTMSSEVKLDLEWLTAPQLLALYEEGFFNTRSSLLQCFDALTLRAGFHGDDITPYLDIYHRLREAVLSLGSAAANTAASTSAMPAGETSRPQGDCSGSLNNHSPQGIAERRAPELVQTTIRQDGTGQLHANHEIRASTSSENVQQTEGDLRYITKFTEADVIIKKFNLTSKRLSFKIRDVDEANTENPLTWLDNAIQELLRHALRNCSPDDLVGLIINNENYPERPLGISFRRADQLTSSIVLDVASKILQSNANFFVQNSLTLQLDHVRLPAGRGHSKRTGMSAEEFCRTKRGILVVENNDNTCLAYALSLSKAYVDKDPYFNHMKISQSRGLLVERASELCRNADVDLSHGGNYTHLQAFQSYLKDYTIVVYNNRRGTSTYFEGIREKNKPRLNLLLENGHYNVILSLTAAFSVGYFCEYCKHRSNNIKDHSNCPYICPCCHSSPPCTLQNNNITCEVCNRDFRGDACFKIHKTALCSALKRCRVCLQTVWLNTKTAHKCGYKRCTTCMKEMPIRHLCYMQPVSRKCDKKNKPFLFVFYDLETRQEKEVKDNCFLHEVNLCISQQACPACVNNDDINADCQTCGKRQYIFDSSDPVNDFLGHVACMSKNFKVTAIAHNMRGFDGCFVARKLFADLNRWNPKMIRNGLKIMSITCENNIRFIDSLNFMPLPLSELPATFKFETLTKGYFPHLFNTDANKNYVGRMPDVNFYSPDTMSVSGREKFLEWYNEQVRNNTVFNMGVEIVKYCIADVAILRKACIKFRECFIDSNSVDPFREATTIASACNLVYRRNFLRKDTIGIIPPGGYRMSDRQSAIAIKWLLWKAHSENLKIEHAGQGREVRLREGQLVDGFSADTNTVYQFHGCFYHGCEKCFPSQNAQLTSDTKIKDMMFMRREHTIAADERIRSLGYNLVTIWECEFRQLLKANPDARKYTDDHDVLKCQPLDPRESFFGGRTNACRLFYECEDESEKICYFDVCSLYPFVNKTKKYPVGHPKVHIGSEACNKLSMDTVEGLVKCTVLPPHDLYHPVLPYRTGGKLTFPLCRTCVETSFQGECTHTVDERKFVGTFVADELRKAISQNYKILELHEIWEYKVEVYDKTKKSGGLFAGYINNFLKIKQESSGWPAWCSSEPLKDQYVDSYKKREGITLTKSDISYNAGRRYLSKLMLNSFWGKFGQRENLMQTSVVNSSLELFQHLTNPSILVHNLTIINEDVLLLTWDRVEESVTPLKTVNSVIASYTAAHARLVLLEYLEKLGRRVLYFDTDSVIFTYKPGDWMPPVGDFLGDLTDEIADKYGAGSRIIAFVSGGPKNYAYMVYSARDGRVHYVCKVKGITLNYKNSQSVNFSILKKMVTENHPQIFIHTDRRIVRTCGFDVFSRPEDKLYRVHYTKRRRLLDSYDTVPYGYRL